MTQSSTDSSLVERLREGPIRTGDTEDGEYELFDVEEATQTMHEAADLISTLERELEEARGDCVRLLTAAQEDFVLMKETAATVMSLTQRERAASIALTAAEAKAARMGEALAWSMDEIDILSNKMSGFAYPQGMVPARRQDQLDNYRKAVDARRSALQSEKDREGGE